MYTFFGTAWVYLDKYFWETYLTESFMDSALILADIALSYDDQLAEAYILRGDYYRRHNEKEQAINEYNKAIKFNPNDGLAFWHKGGLYYHDDLVKTIENYEIAASLRRGTFLPETYTALGKAYAKAGFKEISIFYLKEALILDNDSAKYYSSLAEIEDCYGNYGKGIEFGKKSYAIDSTDNWVTFLLGCHYMYLGQNEPSLEYFKIYDRILKTLERPDPWGIFWIGMLTGLMDLMKKLNSILIQDWNFIMKLLNWIDTLMISILSFFLLLYMHSGETNIKPMKI